MKSSPLRFWFFNGSVLFYLLVSKPTAAQIAPDTTLPNNSIVPPNCTNCEITGGTQVGNNLFHSFEQFSIPTGGSAYFNNAQTIENIISRVTAGSISNIDGLIRANDAANLFLLNPNGIIFGPNASVNIGGSFLATTAERIDFADGTQFRADGTQSSPLLTVSVPSGVQFGQAPGIISNQSVAPLVDRMGNPVLDDGGNSIPIGLRVLPGKTLALVGGSITLPGGYLTAESGRIELGSVAGSGSVSLTPTDQGWVLGYNSIQNFQDISLSQEALVNTSGDTGGDIQIQGRRVTLTQGSQVVSVALSEGQAGDLTVNASELVEIVGTSAGGQFITGLFNEVEEQATGEEGTLTIKTGRLIIQAGARVSATTLGTGRGVDLTVRASESVELVGYSPDDEIPSGIFALVNRGATGDGGTLTIETGRLIVQDGAQVSTATFGTGRAGDLTVRASESVEVEGRTPDNKASGLFAQVEEGATGNGGNLTIGTRQLVALGGAQISTAARSGGQGGTLTINASDSILLSGTSPIADPESISGVFVSAEPGATRNGGELNITTGVLTVEDGAKISADTFSTGQAGNATLNVRHLIIRDGGLVGAGSFGEGPGGTLTVNASDSVQVTGIGTIGSNNIASALFTEALSSGEAGDLNITTKSLNVQDGADVSVSAEGSGSAGNLTITASSIRLDGGRLTAETQGGSGANINLQDVNLLLMGNQSLISAQAFNDANGGDITINAENGFIVAVPEEDTDIIANASEGRGGNIQITTQGIFGIEQRLAIPGNGTNDIDASSQFGVNGVVTINRSDVDPSQGLSELPNEPVNVEVAQGCQAAGTQASVAFFNTGRGGLAPNPYEPISSSNIWEDVSLPTQEVANSAGTVRASGSPATQPDKIVEAKGWIVNGKGEVVLVAEMPTTQSRSRCSLR